jgi:hypothetical protein
MSDMHSPFHARKCSGCIRGFRKQPEIDAIRNCARRALRANFIQETERLYARRRTESLKRRLILVHPAQHAGASSRRASIQRELTRRPQQIPLRY